MQKLGWIINFQKSELVPTQNLDFLGYHFNLQRGLVFPTQNKLDRLKNQTVFIRNSLVLTPRKLLSLIGTLASLEKTVPLGRLHMRPFQWYLKSHWKFPQSIEMCALIWRILAFINSRRIPGSLNVIADSLSRRDKVIPSGPFINRYSTKFAEFGTHQW